MEGGGSEVQVHPYLHKEFQDILGYTDETLSKTKEKEEWGGTCMQCGVNLRWRIVGVSGA